MKKTILVLLAAFVAIVALYVLTALWSEHQARREAQSDCAMAAAGTPVAQYLQQLAKGARSAVTQTVDGQTSVMTTYKTISVSRYVCVVDVVNNVVVQNAVVFKD
jgi:hypothetical protein